MENKERKLFWIALKSDFFNSLRIKKLRKLAGGDTFTIIYLKMQLLSLQDEGRLYYKGIEKTFAEEIALDIDEDVDNVGVTISYLMSCGLLVVCDDEVDAFEMPYVLDAIGCETNGALRSRKYRQGQKEQKLLSNAKTQEYAIIVEIVDYLNATAGTNYRASTKTTQSLIKARLNENFTVNDFKIVIDKKCKEWKGSKMEEYLRPQTLFGTKFESYLNAQTTAKSNIDATYDIEIISNKAMFNENYDI